MISEKQLRDAAAAEVMASIHPSMLDNDDEDDKGRKRKHLNPDEKVKQRLLQSNKFS